MRYALAILIVAAGVIAGLTTGAPGPEPEPVVREAAALMFRAVNPPCCTGTPMPVLIPCTIATASETTICSTTVGAAR